MEHEAVYNSIVSRLEDEGFTLEGMKLDKGCKSGVLSFYMPCTNHAHPDYAFFRTHGTKIRDPEVRSAKPTAGMSCCF
jgi:hypothetical protein